MLIPDRHRALLEQLRRSGSASTEELSLALGVSNWTVRRDLAALEATGQLVRARGGAVLPATAATAGASRLRGASDPALRSPSVPAPSEVKERIGRAAAGLVAEHSTVLILGGSTTSTLLGHLRDRTLTVVTNGLEVAYKLRDAPGITVVLLGGYLHREQMTLLGPMTEAAMTDFHVDAIFAGAWGVDADTGVTGSKIIQGGPHHRMLEHADRLVVLADASKLGRRGPTVLAPIEGVDVLITDSSAERRPVQHIRDRGVDVVVV